jgi:hypothetical protein
MNPDADVTSLTLSVFPYLVTGWLMTLVIGVADFPRALAFYRALMPGPKGPQTEPSPLPGA